MVVFKRLRAELTYYNIPQYKLAQAVRMSKSSLTNKMNGMRGWDLVREVVPIVRFFRILGSKLTIEELFELNTEVDNGRNNE